MISGINNTSDVRTELLIGDVSLCKIAKSAARHAVLFRVALAIVLAINSVVSICRPGVISIFNHRRRLAAIMTWTAGKNLECIQGQAEGQPAFMEFPRFFVPIVKAHQTSIALRPHVASATLALFQICSFFFFDSAAIFALHPPKIRKTLAIVMPGTVQRALTGKINNSPRAVFLANKIHSPLPRSVFAFPGAVFAWRMRVATILFFADATHKDLSAFAMKHYGISA